MTLYDISERYIDAVAEGVKADAVTDDTGAILDAVAKASALELPLLFPNRPSRHTGLDLSAYPKLIIRGASPPGNGPTPTLLYTGSGTGDAVKVSYSTVLDQVCIAYNNPAFTGNVLNVSGSTFTSRLCTILGTSSAKFAKLLAITGGNTHKFSETWFNWGTNGISGEAPSAGNVVNVDTCHFQNLSAPAIINANQAWHVKGSTFEALVAGSYADDDGSTVRTLDWEANWHGDTGSGVGNHIDFQTGAVLYVHGGNLFGQFASGGHAIVAGAGGSSLVGLVLIQGNYFLGSATDVDIYFPVTNGVRVAVVEGNNPGTLTQLINNPAGANHLIRLGNRDLAGMFAVPRLGVAGSSSLAGGAFALSAGWGSTASVAVTGGSKDGRFRVSITAGGSGIAANPTFTVTFTDGTWGTFAPWAVASRGDVLATAGDLRYKTRSATAPVFQFMGTPVSGEVYIFDVIFVG